MRFLLLAFLAAALTTAQPRSIALTDPAALVPKGVKVGPVEYKGRKGILLTKSAEDSYSLALVKGIDFQDGVIEADLAVKTRVAPGVHMPGFIGIAFRVRPDASHYELFYLRPGNFACERAADAQPRGAIYLNGMVASPYGVAPTRIPISRTCRFVPPRHLWLSRWGRKRRARGA